MKIGRLYCILMSLLSLVAFSSCGDDDDDPKGNGAMTSFTELAGVWTSEGGADWIAVVSANHPALFGMNRMSVMWDGRLYDLGVPRLYEEGGVYKLSASQPTPWEIRSYSPSALVFYNPATRTEKEFRFKSDADMSIVQNGMSKSYPFVKVIVYMGDDVLYSVELERGLGYGAKSVPFYMSGDRVVVECYNADGTLADSVEFDDLEAGKFYNLAL